MGVRPLTLECHGCSLYVTIEELRLAERTGLKGFFRRSVKERDSLKYQCTRNGICNITSKTRNVCKMCRYQQCLRAGMKPDKSRIGRQPNAIKHATFVQLNRIKLEKGLPMSDDTLPVCEMSTDTSDYSQNNHDIFVDDTDNFSVTSSSFRQQTKKIKSERKKQKRQRKSQSLIEQNQSDFFEDCSVPFCTNEIKQEIASPRDCNSSDQSHCGSDNLLDCHTDYVDTDQDGFNVNLRQRNLSKIGLSEKDLSRMCQRYIAESTLNSLNERNQSQTHCKSDDIRLANCGDKEIIPVVEKIEIPDRLGSNYLDSIILSMKQAYGDLEVVFSRAPLNTTLTESSSVQEMWDSQMAQFAHCARAILKFSKKVPGFRSFLIEEQISMVQTCMFPIVAVIMSLAYNVEKRLICWFNFTPNEMTIIFERFDPFYHLVDVMHLMGRTIQELNPDELEVAFLCGIHLVDSGTQSIFKEQLIDALEEYSMRKHGSNGLLRKGRILMCLRHMAETNQRHQESVALILSDPRFAHLEVPQLFKETFVGLDGDDEQVE